MTKIIKKLALTEVVIIPTTLYSFAFFINLQVAYLSSLFIVLGTSFAYKNAQCLVQVLGRKRTFPHVI